MSYVTNKLVPPLSGKNSYNYTSHYAIHLHDCCYQLVSARLTGGQSDGALVDMWATLTDISAVAPYDVIRSVHTSQAVREACIST